MSDRHGAARWPFADLTDAILTGRSALPEAAREPFLERAAAVTDSCRFFHWELEFPEVFFDGNGARLDAAGFDAVIGNPPWDMVRADAASSPTPHASAVDPGAVLRFTRDAGVYVAQSSGHANRYHLFVERALALVRPGGRLGLVLPSGLLADAGAAPLRQHLLSHAAVDQVVGFENRAGIFPIHRSVRFALITATAGDVTRDIECRLGETDPAVLDPEPGVQPGAEAGEPHVGERQRGTAGGRSPAPVRFTPALLRRLTGDGLAFPDTRTPLDLAILERATSLYPALGAVDGWAARFGRELNATEDRGCFKPPGHGLPIVEGRRLRAFQVDVAGAAWSIAPAEAQRRLGERVEQPRLAYRDVASATNRQTLIAAILPGGCVSTHTLFCLRTVLPLRAQHFLCVLFNSFVVNYLARLRVSTHVTTAIVEWLPIPPEGHAPAAFDLLADIGRRLAQHHDPAALARANGVVAACINSRRASFAMCWTRFRSCRPTTATPPSRRATMAREPAAGRRGAS